MDKRDGTLFHPLLHIYTVLCCEHKKKINKKKIYTAEAGEGAEETIFLGLYLSTPHKVVISLP